MYIIIQLWAKLQSSRTITCRYLQLTMNNCTIRHRHDSDSRQWALIGSSVIIGFSVMIGFSVIDWIPDWTKAQLQFRIPSQTKGISLWSVQQEIYHKKVCKNASTVPRQVRLLTYCLWWVWTNVRQDCLSQHKMHHTGEKSFTYDIHVCGSRFKQRHTLSIHILTHSENSPFCCEICGRGFSFFTSCHRLN